MEDALKKNLEQLLKEEGLNGRVTDLEYLTGGASNETWKFFFSSKTEKKHVSIQEINLTPTVFYPDRLSFHSKPRPKQPSSSAF